jgi:hypothetical protein
MSGTIQRLAGIAGLIILILAFVAGLAGAGTLGWLLVALASLLLAYSIFTGSQALLHD